MVAFPIDPEIRLRHRRYPVLRTLAEALEFARGMTVQHPDTAWSGMAKVLDRVRTEDDALEAAVAIEMLLEREGMLILETDAPAVIAPPSRAPAQAPQPASASAMSMVYATVSAAPDR